METRNLLEYVDFCKGLLDSLDIEYAAEIVFRLETRKRGVWGECHRCGNQYTISINSDLLDTRNSEKGLEETILHELIHTVPGGMCHTGNWKEAVEKVNRTYGYQIRRADTAEDKGVFYSTRKQPVWKWELTCTKCGNVERYQRAGNVVKHPDRYRCGNRIGGCQCLGKLEVKKI